MSSFSFGRIGISSVWRAVTLFVMLGALLVVLAPRPAEAKPKPKPHAGAKSGHAKAAKHRAPRHKSVHRTGHKRHKAAKQVAKRHRLQTKNRLNRHKPIHASKHISKLPHRPLHRHPNRNLTNRKPHSPRRDGRIVRRLHHDGEQHPPKPEPGPHPKPGPNPPGPKPHPVKNVDNSRHTNIAKNVNSVRVNNYHWQDGGITVGGTAGLVGIIGMVGPASIIIGGLGSWPAMHLAPGWFGRRRLPL